MAIYMKNDKIKGTVTTEGFKDQVELDSCSFNAGREMGMAKRSDKNRGFAEPHLSELSCSRPWDALSSTLLLQDAIAGVGDHKQERRSRLPDIRAGGSCHQQILYRIRRRVKSVRVF
jgi:type VI secretion system secreted protein Hcp